MERRRSCKEWLKFDNPAVTAYHTGIGRREYHTERPAELILFTVILHIRAKTASKSCLQVLRVLIFAYVSLVLKI